jgi:hypothetical protein
MSQHRPADLGIFECSSEGGSLECLEIFLDIFGKFLDIFCVIFGGTVVRALT